MVQLEGGLPAVAGDGQSVTVQPAPGGPRVKGLGPRVQVGAQGLGRRVQGGTLVGAGGVCLPLRVSCWGVWGRREGCVTRLGAQNGAGIGCVPLWC